MAPVYTSLGAFGTGIFGVVSLVMGLLAGFMKKFRGLTWNAFHNLYSNKYQKARRTIMLTIILLCLFIYISAYFCLKASGQSIDVRPIQSFEDYFIDSNEKIMEKQL